MMIFFFKNAAVALNSKQTEAGGLFGSGLTALVLDDDGSCCGRGSAGPGLIVGLNSEFILVSFPQVLHLKPGGVHVPSVTPEGQRTTV